MLGRKPTKEAAARARTNERRRRSLEARPQWMEHFRSRRHQRKLVERDLSRFVYCEDCDLYVENLEFETHKNGSMHLGNVIKAGRLTERRR